MIFFSEKTFFFFHERRWNVQKLISFSKKWKYKIGIKSGIFLIIFLYIILDLDFQKHEIITFHVVLAGIYYTKYSRRNVQKYTQIYFSSHWSFPSEIISDIQKCNKLIPFLEVTFLNKFSKKVNAIWLLIYIRYIYIFFYCLKNGSHAKHSWLADVRNYYI